MKRMKRNSPTAKYTYYPGQSMVEVAVALPFLLLIVIALIEMGIVFASYVALVNAAREGAVFATMYPNLANYTCGSTPNPTCVVSDDSKAYGGGSTVWDEYFKRVNDEIVVSVGDPLKAGQIVVTDTLTLDRPVLGPTCTLGAEGCLCPTGKEIGCPITVTVHYRLHTFTSGISLPVPRVKSAVAPATNFTQWVFNVLGSVDLNTGWRMGLPDHYQLDYSYLMSIR